jgi:hypothetical protein
MKEKLISYFQKFSNKDIDGLSEILDFLIGKSWSLVRVMF